MLVPGCGPTLRSPAQLGEACVPRGAAEAGLIAVGGQVPDIANLEHPDRGHGIHIVPAPC